MTERNIAIPHRQSAIKVQHDQEFFRRFPDKTLKQLYASSFYVGFIKAWLTVGTVVFIIALVLHGKIFGKSFWKGI